MNNQPPRTYTRIAVVVVVAVAIIAASIIYATSTQFTSSQTTSPTVTSALVTCNSSPTELAITENGTTTTIIAMIPSIPCQPQMTLSGFSICVGSCNYPSPYLSGIISVNTSSPVSTLILYINGTYEESSPVLNNFTTYAIGFKANPTDPSMPITANSAYTIKLVAIFKNGLAAVASTQVVAVS